MSKLALHGGRPVRDTPYPPWPVSGPREEELLRQVLFSEQWGGYHPVVGEFEHLFAHLHDATHGVAVVNGSVAIEVALQAMGIGPGDEVIVPALHNTLYQDSWYSALLQPGGRAAYDKGVALVEGMRQQTTR